jgi:hypothetical protein
MNIQYMLQYDRFKESIPAAWCFRAASSARYLVMAGCSEAVVN